MFVRRAMRTLDCLLPANRSYLSRSSAFGLIPKSSERRGDRTPEEKQAFKYARQEKIRWAVLTNFERLHVFDADQERLILAFDDPQEYVQRIEELNRLARANMEHKSLEHFASLQAKEDIDRHFLENLMRWRKLLAQDILDRNANNDAILTAGKPDLDKLRRVVQRILDRLVIIRFADDRELLDDFGVMESEPSKPCLQDHAPSSLAGGARDYHARSRTVEFARKIFQSAQNSASRQNHEIGAGNFGAG